MTEKKPHSQSTRAVFDKDLAQPNAIPTAGIEAASRLMQSGHLFRYGEVGSAVPEAALLEQEFADFIGSRYCLGVNSGGCALFLALKALGVAAGDKVLVNAFTLAPVPGAVAHANAEAVLVDIDQRFVIDLEDLERKAASSGAKVLLLSYMRGHIPDVPAVVAICARHGIRVIEDCAHTMGAGWNGQLTGTFGAIGCFSAQAFKQVNAGEGGLLVSNDPDLIADAIVRSGSYMLYEQHQARPPTDVFERYKSKVPNCSMRMSNLVAAVLRPQIPQIHQRNQRWRQIYQRIARQIEAIPHLQLPQRPDEEQFAPTSIQFTLSGLYQQGMERFIRETASHGVNIKWFGAEDASGFTSRHVHWQYLRSAQSVSTADQLLQGLCDIRLPMTLSDEDCDTLATVLREAMQFSAN